jgi:hypothetical protein
MANGFDFSAEAAMTNEELAGQLATVTALSAAEIERLLPTKADKKALAELIDIVNGAASQNDKVARLRQRFGDLGGVVVKLLKTVVG